MDFWKSLAGYLVVEYTSAAPEQVLDTLIQEQIRISNVVQKEQLTYWIVIHRRDYRKVCRILDRRGDHWKLVSRNGMYWFAKKLVCRPVILTVIFLTMAASVYIPSRIFFLRIEGNSAIPKRFLVSAAEECGICFGASRKLVRSEKVKNKLLSAVPQLQWAGVNTYGCTAVITVRERTEEQQKPHSNTVTNLIADRDGYILSGTVTSGTAHFTAGEAVTMGQLLVSGYTDCGICIRASRAAAEIIAQTNRKMNAVMPVGYYDLEEKEKAGYQISLLLGKKRINLWKDSRISNTGCGRMYEEYFISLPGGFQLPAAICIDRYQFFDLQEALVPEDDAQIQLQKFSEKYLIQQMVAGRILQTQQRFSCADGLYRLESNCTCTEMIGKEQREQIGVINGKRN